MKKKIIRITGLLLAGYFILFAARCIYMLSDLSVQENAQLDTNSGIQLQTSNSVTRMVQNYASTKAVISSTITSKTVTVDQKYEKVATLSSSSVRFESDADKIREIIKSQKAITQQEDLAGIPGKRTLVLEIGVHPDRFDNLVEQLKKVGSLYGFKVVKTDKTGEYKSLMAKVSTQEKYIASLKVIKEKSGSIQEMMELEAKILEIEETLQNYGVQLGSYSAENELCTVEFTLSEKSAPENAYTFMNVSGTVLEAVVWATLTYIGIILLIGLCGLCAYIILLVLGKLGALSKKQ